MDSPNLSLYSVEDLPEEILEMLMDRLHFDDYIRFSATRREFRCFAREIRPYQKPWLMLPNKPGSKTRPFYSPLEKKIYNLKLPKFVRRSFCCGSYDGWLIMAHKTRGNFMHNPITNKRLRLPNHQIIDHFDEHLIKRSPYMLQKVILSTTPYNSIAGLKPPLMAAAMTDNHTILVTCFTDNRWHQFCPIKLRDVGEYIYPTEPLFTLQDRDDQEEEVDLKLRINEGFITDIIFFKGELYAVNNNGDLIIINPEVPNATGHNFSIRKIQMIPLKQKRKNISLNNCIYLVESRCGELLMVLRFRKIYITYDDEVKDPIRYETRKFSVFKLDLDESRWVEVESLGDQVLFLGDNYSKSISSRDLELSPEDTKIRNCIYFSDDKPEYYGEYDSHLGRLYNDIGVYHLDDGSIDNLIPKNLFDHLLCFRYPPIMFTPNPW